MGCVVWDVWCGMWDEVYVGVRCGVWGLGCGSWGTGCRVWVVGGFGLWDVGCGV